MARQVEITIPPKPRGFHLVTGNIERALFEAGIGLPEAGIVNVFCKHTSCGLAISENWDVDVRRDMADDFDRIVPEGAPYYRHTLEGLDDMPSHTKSVLTGASLTIPVSCGKLALGTWQGVYLCEFRDHGGPRRLVVTVLE